LLLGVAGELGRLRPGHPGPTGELQRRAVRLDDLLPLLPAEPEGPAEQGVAATDLGERLAQGDQALPRGQRLGLSGRQQPVVGADRGRVVLRRRARTTGGVGPGEPEVALGPQQAAAEVALGATGEQVAQLQQAPDLVTVEPGATVAFEGLELLAPQRRPVGHVDLQHHRELHVGRRECLESLVDAQPRHGEAEPVQRVEFGERAGETALPDPPVDVAHEPTRGQCRTLGRGLDAHQQRAQPGARRADRLRTLGRGPLRRCQRAAGDGRPEHRRDHGGQRPGDPLTRFPLVVGEHGEVLPQDLIITYRHTL
jgi:hypothetical protein